VAALSASGNVHVSVHVAALSASGNDRRSLVDTAGEAEVNRQACQHRE